MADANAMYYYYRKKENDAYSQKIASQKKETEYRESKSQANSDLQASEKEKLNLEKRLEGVQKIIGMLEGNGALFALVVPDTIQEANKSAETAGNHFEKCIKCPSITSASVKQIFKSDTVQLNTHSANALNALCAEVQRLQKSIEEIKWQISQLKAKIDLLTTQIKRCDANQSTLNKNIRYYSQEKNYWKKKMN